MAGWTPEKWIGVRGALAVGGVLAWPYVAAKRGLKRLRRRLSG